MGLQVVSIGDGGIYPLEALSKQATELKTALATCKLRLFKSSIVSVSETTSLATLDAAQADFSGYTADGVTVTAAGDPYISLSDYSLRVQLPSQQFNFTTPAEDPPVTNTIGGAYVVDSAGVLRGAVRFAANETMAGDLNSIVVALTFVVKNPAVEE